MFVHNNIGIYFSREETKEMLQRFGQAIRDGQYTQKLNYKIYRELRDNAYGFYINEDDATYEVFLTDGTTEIFTDKNGHRSFISQKGDVWLTDIEKTSDFGRFLFDNYLVYHSDFRLQKEVKEMPKMKTLKEECYYRPEDAWHYWDEKEKTAQLVYSEDLEDDLYSWNTTSSSSVNKPISNTIESTKYGLSLSDYNGTEIKSIEETIDERIEKKINDEKEKDKVMKGFNFDFGPCTGDNVRMSMYGLAVKNNNGEWVSYNPSTKQIVNVDILNFDGRKFMFKMPVAIKDIAVGDIVVHNRVPMFVIGTDKEGGAVTAVDVKAGEEKKILPTTSPFGFNFVTKVVSMFSAFENTPTPDAPFGNFLPFMLMNDEDAGSEPDPLVMMMMLQNSGTNAFNNPMMMMYFLGGEKVKDNWMLPFLMMNQVAAPATPNSK